MSSIPSIAAVFLRKHRLIAVSRRALTADTYPDHWQNVGGKVHADEDPIAAAVRETIEEAGLTIDQSRFRQIDETTCDDQSGGPYRVFVFVVDLADREQPIQAEPQKAGPWYFMRPDDVPHLKPVVPALIQSLASLNRS